MDQPPRSKKDALLNKGIVIKAFLWYGLIASAISMGAYFFVNILNDWPGVPLASEGLIYKQATTMTLAAIVFCQVGAVFNCRTAKQSIFKVGLFSNKKVLFGIVFEILLLCALIYVPFLQNLFDTAPIGLKDWALLAIIPIPMVLFEEIRKAISRKYKKSKIAGGK